MTAAPSTTPRAVRAYGPSLYWSSAYWLVCAVCWVGYVLGAWWLDRWAIGVAPDAYLAFRTVLGNSLIGLLLAIALTALTRRALFSMLVIAVLHALLCIASRLKLSILGDPVALQDLYFLTSIDRASFELFSMYLPRQGMVMLAAFAAPVLLAVLFVFERRGARPSSKIMLALRFACAAIPAGLLLALYFAAWPWSAVYNKHEIRPSPLNLTTAVLRGGLVGSLAYSRLQAADMTFDVDTDAIKRSIALLPRRPHGDPDPPAVADPDMRPHVVVVLSESFMDPRVLSGMGELTDVIPETRRLIDAGAGGEMRVPTYGGGTVRTEFEVLTGMPVSAFPAAYYPYVNLSRKSIPGLASVLAGLGYRSVAIHGNSGTFWNRTNTYKAMGIEKFITSREFRERGKRDGSWYSDSSMTNFILEEIEASRSPVFVAAISIENHGPYNTAPERSGIADLEAWRAIDVPAGLDEEAEIELRNYLYHLRNADAQLARLVQRLQRNDRPFVIAFFGDHLPALSHAYGALGFADGEVAERQRVPWVIVRDRRLPEVGLAPVQESWQLAAELMARAGLPSGRYLGLAHAVAREINGGSPDADVLRAGLDAAANANITGGLERHVDTSALR